MSLPVEWSVSINGLNVTRSWNRYVESIEYNGKSGGVADSASLVFDNNGGRLSLPPKGSPIEITVMGRLRFKGFTDKPEIVVSRGGGRTLQVSCSAIKKTGKIKENLRLHKDDCTLQEFLNEAAKKAGVAGIKVDDELGKIKRPYWNSRGRNFLQLGQSLADELGATFKVRGDQAVFAGRGAGMVPGGGATPTIRAVYGDNLIEARISPFIGRPKYAKARVRWYDRKEAKHKTKDVEIGDVPGGSGVLDALVEGRPDEEQAGQAGKGRKIASDREGGDGSVTILLEVNAEAEGTCILVGVGEGADGVYRIESWSEKIERDGGAETKLELKQPQESGGSASTS